MKLYDKEQRCENVKMLYHFFCSPVVSRCAFIITSGEPDTKTYAEY